MQSFKHFWQPSILTIAEAVHGGDAASSGGVPPHWHAEWQLCSVVRGDGWVRVRGVQHQTPAGSLFAIPPGEVHSNDTFAEGCDYRSILLATDAIEQAFDAAGLPCDVLGITQLPMIHAPQTVQRFVRFHRMLGGTCQPIEVECTYAQVITELLSQLTGRVAEDPRRFVHPAVHRARELLWDQSERSISLSSLADQCGLSLFELARQFTASFGMPPHAWQIQARIVKAKSMLRRGESASHAALATGFSDQAHLTRMFRRTVGTTPARYARQVRKIVQDDSTGPQ